jgi:hypothetical protein
MHGCARPSGVQIIVRPILLLVILALAAGGAGAQERPRPSGGARPDVDVTELPISVDRIEENLQTPSAISLEVTRPLFRVEIVAPRPPDWLENIDWLGTRDRIGPTVPVPSLHDQYLARVTPQEVQPFSSFAFGNVGLLQVAITSFLQSLATKKVVEEVPEQLRDQREEAARREVDDAIARWQKLVEDERLKNQKLP